MFFVFLSTGTVGYLLKTLVEQHLPLVGRDQAQIHPTHLQQHGTVMGGRRQGGHGTLARVRRCRSWHGFVGSDGHVKRMLWSALRRYWNLFIFIRSISPLFFSNFPLLELLQCLINKSWWRSFVTCLNFPKKQNFIKLRSIWGRVTT